jgi:hypothetical protein
MTAPVALGTFASAFASAGRTGDLLGTFAAALAVPTENGERGHGAAQSR